MDKPLTGDVDEMGVERSLHMLLGHSRPILQTDIGGMPHQAFPRSIELLAERYAHTSKRLEP